MEASFTPSYRGGSGSPMVLLHGFTDTWRTWELVLPALEREHDVLAPTLPGHAGGPPLNGEVSEGVLADAVERAMDAAGFETADIVGNSLGGYVALMLAARGRAKTVVGLAPAGGWAIGDSVAEETGAYFVTTQELVKAAAPHADAIMASPEGRRRATAYTAVNYEHIPAELLAHQLRGAANCEGAGPLIELWRREPMNVDAARIKCPVRIVWGTADKILHWPAAAARYRNEWLPNAEWVELDGVGHLPQLDVPLETSELILGFTNGH
jgi:pimeloyl-ACP methyl ester carboxylesterase